MRAILVSFLCASACLAQDYTIEKDIFYSKYPETKLDVIQPKAPAAGKRPGMIWIHGGGWVNGTKESQLNRCLDFVRQGFVCANVEYRLAKAATAPAAVEDALQAADWFYRHAAQYNVDTKRLVVCGGSAGGHLALMVGLTPKSAHLGPPSHVRAVLNFYGITDVADQLDGPNQRKYAVAWVPEQPGRVALAKRVSPMTYVRKKVPAILTLHGDADPTVPYEHGAALTKALRAAGADAELVTVPGGKHGFTKEATEQVYEKNVWPFLQSHGILKGVMKKGSDRSAPNRHFLSNSNHHATSRGRHI